MRKTLALLLLCANFSLSLHAQWIWNRNKLEEIKQNIHSFTYAGAYRQLLLDADKAMKDGTYSVTFKEGIAPSGDKHDYVSMSRYFWPNPDKPDRLPYVYRDGESNPELNKYDRNPLGNMANAVTTLSLAYFYSGEERYAKKATQLLRVWFLDKKTRMNPHLNYAQFVPGMNGNKGNPSGLIDSYSFVAMLDAVKLLETSSHYKQADKEGLRRWFADFAVWWQNSGLGQTESRQGNNHGTTYDMQLTMFLLFSGDETAAEKIVREFPEKRLFRQIEPDGSQPRELRRTLAFHYSVYNLQFFVDMCAMARTLGVDLLKTVSDDGRSVYRAVDFLTPYLGKEVTSWPYRQISGWEDACQFLCGQLYRLVGLDASCEEYLKLYLRYSRQGMADRNRLLYGAENPIEDTFAAAGRQLKYALACADSSRNVSADKKRLIPRCVNKDGSLRLVDTDDWCSGFFPGSLWFMYHHTKDDSWKEEAMRYTRWVEEAKEDNFSHDIGFKIFCSSGNAYRETGADEYKEVVVEASRSLATRYKPHMKLIRSWDFNQHKWQYPVIIDNMMNLELLFEASLYTGDETWHCIADHHAHTTMKNHFRDDYSSFHVVDYDTITGKARLKQTHQGYADASAWARGQGWGIYGFTMAYRYTGRKAYLKQAQHIARFICTHSNLPADFVPYWDFNAPEIPNAPRDVSAACVIASALYELATYSPSEKEQYIAWADKILESLINGYRAEVGTHKGFILLHSVGNKPSRDEIDAPISYADYYFLEALTRRAELKE